MQDYRNLLIWQKAHEVALTVYQITMGFPADERFGLTNQLRRASVSIPSNIAEGCGRDSDGDMRRFTQIAMGSANEVEYQLFLARELGFLDEGTHEAIDMQLKELKRMMNAFIRKLKVK